MSTGPAEAHLAAVGGRALVDHVGRLLDVARAGLPEGLAAAYVVGSIASGDARGAVSDLDLMLVTPAAVGDRATLGRLGEALADAGQQCPLRGVELVLYRKEVLGAPRHPLPYDLNVNSGPRMPRLVRTGGDEAFWFLLDVAAARAHALTLEGPPVEEMIGPVPDDDVRRALRAALHWHARQGDHGPDAVLNACRAWHWLRHGRWLPKTAAGRWVAAKPGAPAVVAQAVRARLAERDAELDPEAVRHFLVAVGQRLEDLPEP